MCLEGPLNATESTVPARFRPTRVGASLTHLCPQSSQRSRAQRKHPTREPLSDHRTRRCRTGTPGLAAVEDDVCIKTCIYSRVPNTALGGRQGGDYLALTKRDAEAQRGTHSDPAKATQLGEPSVLPRREPRRLSPACLGRVQGCPRGKGSPSLPRHTLTHTHLSPPLPHVGQTCHWRNAPITASLSIPHSNPSWDCLSVTMAACPCTCTRDRARQRLSRIPKLGLDRLC